MDTLVQARGLTKHFKPAGVWTLTKAKLIKAVDDVSFDIEKGTLRRVSDAPYIAFQARAHGDSIRFLNRKGWKWVG